MKRGRRGHIIVGFICYMHAVSISTNVHGEVYSKLNYVIKFVGDLLQVGGFLLILRFPLPIKPTATI